MIIKGQSVYTQQLILMLIIQEKACGHIYSLIFLLTHLCLSNFFVISDLLTEDSKVFLKIKLISGELTAGDPLSGEGTDRHWRCT